MAREMFPESDLTRNALYHAMFLFQSQTSNDQINPDNLQLPNLAIRKEKCVEVLDLGESLFDLTLELMPSVKREKKEKESENEGIIEGDFIHSSSLFSPSIIKNMVQEFLEILESMAKICERRGSEVENVLQLEGKRKWVEEESKESRIKRRCEEL